MKAKKNILWSRRLLLVLAAPVIWFGLASGVFALSTRSIILGAIEIIAAFAILFLVTNKRVGEFVEGRPIKSISLVFVVLYLIFLGISKIDDLMTTKIYFLNEIDFPNVILIVSAIGYLLFLALVIFDLLRLMILNED